MTNNLSALSENVRRIAEAFVQKSYPKEISFFVIFWESFVPIIEKFEGVATKNWPIAKGTQRVASDLGFADFKSLDLVTPIVLCTVAKVLVEARSEELTVSEVKTIVKEVAASCGASGQLLARLIRHLPKLYIGVRTAKPGVKQAFISTAKKPQYEVCTGGGPARIVNNIGKYEKKKSKYVFWIDITNEECESLGVSKRCLKPTARKLLLFLAENTGISIPRRDVYEHVVGVSPDGAERWGNLLDQYMSQLQKFSEENFRDLYLVRDRLTDTLSVKGSFRDKYFVFMTLRPPEK